MALEFGCRGRIEWYRICVRCPLTLSALGWRCLMGKEKTAAWNVLFAAEVKWPLGRSATIDRNYESRPRRRRLDRRRPVIASAALVAALAATASSGVLADKGGHPHQVGAPDVNLGLARFQNLGAGVGPLVPQAALNAAPGLVRAPVMGPGAAGMPVPSASALTPASGLPPPGQLATPGLRLGQPSSGGPSATGNGFGPSDNGIAPGTAVGGTSNQTGSSSSTSNAAVAQTVATANASDRASALENETSIRRIPVCR